jgi:hypothetical protein
MKYMILVKATEDSEASVMPSEKLLMEMGGFHKELAEAGVLVDASGLRASSKGWRIKYAPGGKRSFVDGPFAETKELVAGFWLWEVKDLAEAVAWVKRCPNPMLGPSEIEIRPLYEAADFQ